MPTRALLREFHHALATKGRFGSYEMGSWSLAVNSSCASLSKTKKTNTLEPLNKRFLLSLVSYVLADPLLERTDSHPADSMMEMENGEEGTCESHGR